MVSRLDLFEPHVPNLVSLVPAGGSVFDLATLFHRLAADIATEFLFGESISSLQKPERLETGVLKALHDAQSGCELRWLLGSLTAVVPQPVFFRNVSITHCCIRGYIDAALGFQKTNLREPTMDERLVFLKHSNQVTQDPQVLQDEILTLYLAASDATAALLINLFFVLAERPEIWARLRSEVQHIDGLRPTEQQLKSLQYLNFCIRESKGPSYSMNRSLHPTSTRSEIASTPSPATPESLPETPSSLSAEAQTASRAYLSPSTAWYISVPLPDIAGGASGARMPKNSVQNGGLISGSLG
ncbi:MAG: hypothetical protein LQ340_004711 [Diploschistes diacapsis]|nr:MAG: hypothetical protein LQ340_004711 [Diploschistes diacapsis]